MPGNAERATPRIPPYRAGTGLDWGTSGSLSNRKGIEFECRTFLGGDLDRRISGGYPLLKCMLGCGAVLVEIPSGRWKNDFRGECNSIAMLQGLHSMHYESGS